MGMRIKTAIGFGLDLTGLNTDHLHNRYKGDEKLWSQLTQDILDDIQASKPENESKNSFFGERMFFSPRMQDKAVLKENRMVPFHLENCIHYDDEFFRKDKVLMRPYPFGRKWYRHDDDIDYFVSGILDPLLSSTEIIWEETKRSIYPHVGLMRRNPEWHLGVETYMESCYMDRDPEYVATLTAAVPLQIQFFIKHLFQVEEKDLLDVFFRVKPVFARWWS